MSVGLLRCRSKLVRVGESENEFVPHTVAAKEQDRD